MSHSLPQRTSGSIHLVCSVIPFVSFVYFVVTPLACPYAAAADRPNILWVSIEDTSPDLGCYGDKYAVTPNLDRLASQGCRYTNCFTHAGVCAPSRSGIITGMYPTSMGTQFMRCKGVPPAYVKCFTEYLRAAGYYCTNDNKTDYNFDPPLTAWDDSRRGAPLARSADQRHALLRRHQPDAVARKPGAAARGRARSPPQDARAARAARPQPKPRCRRTILIRRASAAIWRTCMTTSPSPIS